MCYSCTGTVSAELASCIALIFPHHTFPICTPPPSPHTFSLPSNLPVSLSPLNPPLPTSQSLLPLPLTPSLSRLNLPSHPPSPDSISPPSPSHPPSPDSISLSLSPSLSRLNLPLPLTLPLSPCPDKDAEERTLASLTAAQRKIKIEIHDLSDRLKVSREAIQKLKEQLEHAEEG